MRRTLSAISIVLASMFVAAVPASASTSGISVTVPAPGDEKKWTYVDSYDSFADCYLAGLSGNLPTEQRWGRWVCWESEEYYQYYDLYVQ